MLRFDVQRPDLITQRQCDVMHIMCRTCKILLFYATSINKIKCNFKLLTKITTQNDYNLQSRCNTHVHKNNILILSLVGRVIFKTCSTIFIHNSRICDSLSDPSNALAMKTRITPCFKYVHKASKTHIFTWVVNLFSCNRTMISFVFPKVKGVYAYKRMR